jgi:hypothetical protein
MLKDREIDKLRLLSSAVKHTRIHGRRTYRNEQFRRIDGIDLWSHVLKFNTFILQLCGVDDRSKGPDTILHSLEFYDAYK